LRRLRHPNIVHFHGVVFWTAAGDDSSFEISTCSTVDSQATHMQLGLVLERVAGVELGIFAKDCDTPSLMTFIAIDLCRALRYLHHQNPPVVHGDLKPQNILSSAVAQPQKPS